MRYLVLAASVAMLMILTFEMGKLVGYTQGKIAALSINPISDELELICAGLWIGEQNRKYCSQNGGEQCKN